MEVTPLEYRDASVSSGEGARSDRRQASPTDNTTSTAKANAKFETGAASVKLPAPEQYPVDVIARQLATNLLRIAPGLDPKLAQTIADQLLTKAEKKEATAAASVDSAIGTTVDFTA